MPRRRRKPLVTVNGQALTRKLAKQIYATYGSPPSDDPIYEATISLLPSLLGSKVAQVPAEQYPFPDERFAEYDDTTPPIEAKQRAWIEERCITRTPTGSRARKINRAKLPPRRTRRRRSPKNLDYIPRQAIAA